MAAEWLAAFERLGQRLGFGTRPLLTYAATGSNGRDLPEAGEIGGASVKIDETLLGATLTTFLTEYSATAALDGVCRKKVDFRAASLPGLARSMEDTALSADYREVARRCRLIDERLRGAERVDVRFSTGHTCSFDVRYRRPEVDDGQLPRGKPGDRVINLPSGETFVVPYEGERPGEPSRTAGTLPVVRGKETVLLRVEANLIVEVEGAGPEAAALRAFFAADRARANIAEVAFGTNDRAVVTGNVLEDEKAGFHFAWGRSDHLGGAVGVAAFLREEHVVHQDVVFAKGSPIHVARAVAVRKGAPLPIIADGEYVLW
jgi:leucyl aminopeptidase (aminopeptidase T)